MPKVSVIMPVYNSREYLSEAVASVLLQEFGDFELLLMDDGSTDGSQALCDELGSRDARIRVFHKENGGMCQTRNVALECARGDYVAYCDNDDAYLPGLLGDNVRIAECEGADCVRFGRTLEIISESGGHGLSYYGGPTTTATYRDGEIFDHYDQVRAGTSGVWAGLYRREFIIDAGIRFDERLRRGFEDIIFNADVCRWAHVIALNPKAYYVWRRREGHSSSFVVDENYLLGLEVALQRECDLMRERGVRERMPSYYCERVMGLVLASLGTTSYGRSSTYAEALPLYRRITDVLSPYANDLEARKHTMSRASRLMFTALMAQRYRKVHAYVALGGAYKRIRGRMGR